MDVVGFVVQVLTEGWAVLAESAPYLLFGFLAAGVLHAFVSTDAVGRHLGNSRVGSVVKAALVGIPLPLCSCGVLPAAIGLRRKGASKGATLSFLVSTPETGVDSMALTYALMGPVFAVVRPLAAFLTAVVAGVSENLWGDDAPPPEVKLPCGCAETPLPDSAPLGARLREGLRYAFVNLLGDLAPWLGVGFLLAGLIGVLVPDAFIQTYLGQGWVPLLVMLAVGIPLYICATASTPIAAALLLKGLSPGAALVFLLVGPATNLASLSVLSGTLGLGTTARYLAAIAGTALAMGWLLDVTLPGLGAMVAAGVGGGGEIFPAGLELASALLLVALAVWPRLPLRRGGHHACSGAT